MDTKEKPDLKLPKKFNKAEEPEVVDDKSDVWEIQTLQIKRLVNTETGEQFEINDLDDVAELLNNLE